MYYIFFSGYTNMWHNLGNFSFDSLNEITEQVNCFYFSKACYWQLLHNQQILWQENLTILLYVLIYCANKYNSHTHTNINVLYLYEILNFFCDATACSLSGLYVTIHEWVHPDCHRICGCFGPDPFWECWPADLWQVSFIYIVKRIIESMCGYNTHILWQLWNEHWYSSCWANLGSD